ncbi:hypothetical protein A1Z84_RS14440 [Acinetobacter baumannii]|uniref:hypothetical protein n=1 Tax=Acinetobacter baumannii TaxID=470 RepID=UPI001CDB5E79|nr:hypothetical protein [Acinetobacter baumannii]EHU1446253.1 hypothetical protein [Acinetobacter baumannii]EHU2667450.1 hypothetical protein [Acinetobacter baumannii]EHU3276442.1 hypothetical protein [Acinetobacter baumannii]MCA4414247.1 hypothetical protein [Acinetobacter baumannii]
MSNTQDKTACADLDVAKLVEDTIFWFEQRMETLNDIAGSVGNVVLAGEGGEKELNDAQSLALKAGISTAISLIGKFPLSLDRSVNPIDLDDLEA